MVLQPGKGARRPNGKAARPRPCPVLVLFLIEVSVNLAANQPGECCRRPFALILLHFGTELAAVADDDGSIAHMRADTELRAIFATRRSALEDGQFRAVC